VAIKPGPKSRLDRSWIHVIGIGEDGLKGLTPVARAALDQSVVVFGGERHLKMLGRQDRALVTWPKPFAIPAAQMRQFKPGPVAVLATGDPFHFGVGAALSRSFKPEEMAVFPGTSAFSLAAARMGWSLEEVTCISLHGRPISNLASVIVPDQKILALGVGDTSQKVADLLTKYGFGPSVITALSRMGGEGEEVLRHEAHHWPSWDIHELTTLAIECKSLDKDRPRSRVPGIADSYFEHDGQITKRDVRAVTLSRLAPSAGELLWDVGSGCGSVAIEWMRAAPRTRAIAIECATERVGMILRNAEALGVPGLEIASGAAPEVLRGLEAPDAIFIGGGVSNVGVLERCWQSLKVGGRLVANAVTLEAEFRMMEFAAREEVVLTRMQLATAQPLGKRWTWRPALPITQMCVEKLS
jgi:precorrin-6Y C5,15-methyltransferase (decarboxylating)